MRPLLLLNILRYHGNQNGKIEPCDAYKIGRGPLLQTWINFNINLEK